MSSKQNVPTLFGSSFNEFNVKYFFERIGKNVKLDWVLGDTGIVVIHRYILWKDLTHMCVSYSREVSSMENNLRAHVLFSQGWYIANTILGAREVRMTFALNDSRRKKGERDT